MEFTNLTNEPLDDCAYKANYTHVGGISPLKLATKYYTIWRNVVEFKGMFDMWFINAGNEII